MATITYDSFIRFMNKKYRKELGLSDQAVLFYDWDGYSCWLFFDKNNENVEEYYQDLEEDLIAYIERQEWERRKKRAKGKSREESSEENS